MTTLTCGSPRVPETPMPFSAWIPLTSGGREGGTSFSGTSQNPRQHPNILPSLFGSGLSLKSSYILMFFSVLRLYDFPV